MLDEYRTVIPTVPYIGGRRTGCQRAAIIPEKDDQLANRLRRSAKGGRPSAFDATIYRRRNVVERAYNRFKHWCGLASRYAKTALNYLGGLILASLLLWAES
jgi:transposase